MQQVQYKDCGQIDYQEAWDLQEKLLKQNTDLKLGSGRGADPFGIATLHHLLFCEHNHVYTLGKSGKEDHLLISPEDRDRLGVSYYRINRGGDITYHGPGQITGYPIFDLEKFKPDIHWYLRLIEEAVITLIARYGLEGARMPGFTGVWLKTETDYPQKICAIGVRCSRWTTMHGFAFNVNTDLGMFKHILPCGLEGKGVTSLQAELGREMDFEAIKLELKEELARQFGYTYS